LSACCASAGKAIGSAAIIASTRGNGNGNGNGKGNGNGNGFVWHKTGCSNEWGAWLSPGGLGELARRARNAVC
jgi:hypothetical protein